MAAKYAKELQFRMWRIYSQLLQLFSNMVAPRTWALPPFCTMLSKIRVESRVSQTYATGLGDRVADTVRSCSDSVVNSSAGHHKEDWQTRKTQYIEHLNTVDRETLLVLSIPLIL